LAFLERPEGATALRRTFTRRDFLKAAGASTAGLAMLGAGACDSGGGVKREMLRGTGGNGQNVVLIIVDTLRKDHIGAYGNDWIQTPNLDALAGESLRFTRAYPESTPTICARRAIHTGTRTWPFRDWDPPEGENISLRGWQPIPLDQVTLAEVLKENGYLNLFVSDNLQQYKPAYNMHRGFDVWDFFRGQTTDRYRPIWTCPPESLERAFVANAASATGGEEYFAQYFANVADRRGEEDWFAPRVFNRASEFLESAKDMGPFFLTVDVYDPHAPWDPPEKYTNMYSEGADGPEPFAPVYGPSDYLTERQIDRMNALYSGELTLMDRWLGHFMDKMEELNLFEDTLVLLLSDHGMILGEHGLVGKPHYALYPETVDVPFMIRHPGGKLSGGTDDYFASTHDVAPTILGHLGIDPPDQMTGQNLMTLFEGGEPEARPHFTLGYHDHVWARDDRYAMFSADDGTGAKLFDVQQDPEMNDDIAAGNPDVVKRMYDGYVLRDAGGPLPDYG